MASGSGARCLAWDDRIRQNANDVRLRLEAWWATPHRDLVLRALVELRDAEALYIAGRVCPDERCASAVADALVETGCAKHLYLAGKDWPDGRFLPEIAEALAKSGNAEHLYLVGRYRSAGRVSDKLAEALRECGNAYWTAQAKTAWRALS